MNIQLAVSCLLLQDKTQLQLLLQQLAQTKQNITIEEESCHCESHELVYQKIRMVCSGQPIKTSVFSVKIWSTLDLISPALLKAHTFNILISSCNNFVDLGDTITTIVISEMEELCPLLDMGLFQLQRRGKIEHRLRNTHSRYEIGRSEEWIKGLAIGCWQRKVGKQLKSFLGFMRFNTRSYLRNIRKCFTIWVIQRYESSLERMNNEIVDNSYFCRVSKRRLQKWCMDSWKSLVRSSRKKEYY